MSSFENAVLLVLILAVFVFPVLAPFVVFYCVKLGTGAYLLTKRRFDQNFRKGSHDHQE